MGRKDFAILAAALILGLGTTGFAAEKKAAKPRPAPQLAGFGMISPRHSCTMDYETCLKKCGTEGGMDCRKECDSDCEVCSLDFGEEYKDVCHHR